MLEVSTFIKVNNEYSNRLLMIAILCNLNLDMPFYKILLKIWLSEFSLQIYLHFYSKERS